MPYVEIGAKKIFRQGGANVVNDRLYTSLIPNPSPNQQPLETPPVLVKGVQIHGHGYALDLARL